MNDVNALLNQKYYTPNTLQIIGIVIGLILFILLVIFLIGYKNNLVANFTREPAKSFISFCFIMLFVSICVLTNIADSFINIIDGINITANKYECIGTSTTDLKNGDKVFVAGQVNTYSNGSLTPVSIDNGYAIIIKDSLKIYINNNGQFTEATDTDNYANKSLILLRKTQIENANQHIIGGINKELIIAFIFLIWITYAAILIYFFRYLLLSGSTLNISDKVFGFSKKALRKD
jgi:hypothetical protein